MLPKQLASMTVNHTNQTEANQSPDLLGVGQTLIAQHRQVTAVTDANVVNSLKFSGHLRFLFSLVPIALLAYYTVSASNVNSLNKNVLIIFYAKLARKVPARQRPKSIGRKQLGRYYIPTIAS
jgi:hypothetical protein